MPSHVIKYDHKDGVRLARPSTWCGRQTHSSFAFLDAQHVALAVGGSIQPCKNCVKAIIKELEKEL